MSEDLTDAQLQELAAKRGFNLQEKSSKNKRYKSVRCNAGCGHIFLKSWNDHVQSSHNGKDPEFTRRRFEQ